MMTERLGKLPLVCALLAALAVAPVGVQADDDDKRRHHAKSQHIDKHAARHKSGKHHVVTKAHRKQHHGHAYGHKHRQWRADSHHHGHKLKHKKKHKYHRHGQRGHSHSHDYSAGHSHYVRPTIILGGHDHIAVLDDLHFKIGIHTGNFDFIFHD